jgi:hypothetical protein
MLCVVMLVCMTARCTGQTMAKQLMPLYRAAPGRTFYTMLCTQALFVLLYHAVQRCVLAIDFYLRSVAGPFGCARLLYHHRCCFSCRSAQHFGSNFDHPMCLPVHLAWLMRAAASTRLPFRAMGCDAAALSFAVFVMLGDCTGCVQCFVLVVVYVGSRGGGCRMCSSDAAHACRVAGKTVVSWFGCCSIKYQFHVYQHAYILSMHRYSARAAAG